MNGVVEDSAHYASCWKMSNVEMRDGDCVTEYVCVIISMAFW